MKQLDTLFPVNFSNSMLADIWQCEMYFFRKHCQRFTGMIKNPHLIAGDHVAKSCELIRKEFYNNGTSAEDAIEKGIEYILTAEDTGSVEKSNEVIAMAVKKYFKRFPLDTELSPMKLSDGTHAIEYEFVLDMGIPHPEIVDTNLTFKGKIDGVYGRRFQNNLTHIYILDEKSTKNISRLPGQSRGGKIKDINKETDKFRMSGQFIGYAFALKPIGIKVDGAIVRRIPLLKDFEESYELSIPITPFMIENWAKVTFNKVNELVEKYKFYKTNSIFPQEAFYPVYQNSACTSYNSICEFYHGCVDKEGEEYIASQLHQMIWDSEKRIQVPMAEYKKTLKLKEIK